MAAKERTKQKVKQRLRAKLENVESQEEMLYTLLHNYVAKAKNRAGDVLKVEDTASFLQQYGQIEQLLDRVFNTCELLTTSAEDMIENGGDELVTMDTMLDEPVSFTQSALLSSTYIPEDPPDKEPCQIDETSFTASQNVSYRERLPSNEEIKQALLDILKRDKKGQRSHSQSPHRQDSLASKLTRSMSQDADASGKVQLTDDLPVFNGDTAELHRPAAHIDRITPDNVSSKQPSKHPNIVVEDFQLPSKQVATTVEDSNRPNIDDACKLQSTIKESLEGRKSIKRHETSSGRSVLDNEKATGDKGIECHIYDSELVEPVVNSPINSSSSEHIEISKTEVDNDDVNSTESGITDEFELAQVVNSNIDLKISPKRGNICKGNVTSVRVSSKCVPSSVKKHFDAEFENESGASADIESDKPDTDTLCTRRTKLRKKSGNTGSSDPHKEQVKNKAKCVSPRLENHQCVRKSSPKKKCKYVAQSVPGMDRNKKARGDVESVASQDVNTANRGKVSNNKVEVETSNVNTEIQKKNITSNTNGELQMEGCKSSEKLSNQKSDKLAAVKQNVAADVSIAISNVNEGVSSSFGMDDILIGEKGEAETKQVLVPGTLLPGKITPVVISEIISPWCFFLNQNGPKLPELMEQICIHMSVAGYKEPHITDPHIGMTCLARYSKDNNFYRAYIMQTYTASTDVCVSEVDVLYVDYGNRERVRVNKLRKLPPKFTDLPAQAICCALAEVMPVNKYGLWTDSNINMFRQCAVNQQLNCTVNCRSSDPSVPILVELVVNYPMPATQRGNFLFSQISVATLLVNSKAAKSVAVTDQIGMLAKSGEGQDEAAILSQEMTSISCLDVSQVQASHGVSQVQASHDVSQSSQCVSPAVHGVSQANQRVSQTSQGMSQASHGVSRVDQCMPQATQGVTIVEDLKTICTRNASKGDHLPTSSSKSSVTSFVPSSATQDVNKDVKVSRKTKGSSSKETRIDIGKATEGQGHSIEAAAITPRSETSETESQRDEQPGCHGDQEKHLDRIKEEEDSVVNSVTLDLQELDGIETASVCTTSTTDLDMTGIDLQLNNLTFDLEDECLNPQGQEVMLAHVKSPGEFYIHIISQQSGQTLDKLMRALSQAFEKANRRKLTKLSKTFDLAVGKPCCAQFTKDDNFYRGVVKSLTPKNQIAKGRVLVHYMDFGDEEWLPRRRIFPLPAAFSSVPRMAVRCYLAYVKPCGDWNESTDPKQGDGPGLIQGTITPHTPSNSGDNHGNQTGKGESTEKYKAAEWSEESINMFVDLAGLEKTLHMHIVKGSLADQKNSELESETARLGVVLVDKTSSEEICINMSLIREGYVQLDTSSPNTQQVALLRQDSDDHPSTNGTIDTRTDARTDAQTDTLTDQERSQLADWNPMEEDFLSIRNSYNIDTDDVGVATAGYKTTDDNICRFFSRGKKCYRGELCPFKHILADSGGPQEVESVYAIDSNQQELVPRPGSWIAMEVTTIVNPARFYVLLPMGSKSLDNLSRGSNKSHTGSVFDNNPCEETLDDLLAAINVEYSKRSAHNGSLYLRAMGEIVAARYSQDHQWYRARIVCVTEEKVKVFYLDFGNTEWLPEREVSDIKPEFLHLPFQALECMLAPVQPLADETWSKEAIACFRELVDGKTLIGHVKSSWNGHLMVDLFDTMGDTDINIAEVLVEMGMAAHVEANTDVCNTPNANSDNEDVTEILIPG